MKIQLARYFFEFLLDPFLHRLIQTTLIPTERNNVQFV